MESQNSTHATESDSETEQSIGSGSDHGVFFADATLNLEDAHDLADEDAHSSADASLPDNPSAMVESMNGMEGDSGLVMSDFSSTRIRNSITKNAREYGQISNTETLNSSTPTPEALAPKFRPRPPRHFKDRSFTLIFVLFIPLSLFLTRIFAKKYPSDTNIIQGWTHAASSPQARPYTYIPLFLTTAIALFAARFMYKIPGGGEGENARHKLSNIFNQSSILAALSHLILTFQIYFLTPHARYFALFPATWVLIDIFIKRELCLIGTAGLSTTTAVGTSYSEMAGRRGIWGSLLPGRMVFFYAMVDVSLDILSRSLRRAVFMRVIMTVLAVQGVLLFIWTGGFWKLLGLELHGLMKFIVTFSVVSASWWMCSFLSRVLGLIASGGITSWFANQDVVLQEEEELNPDVEQNNLSDMENPDSSHDEDLGGYAYGMQDAYRSVDASAYSSVRDYDEGIEDEYPTEDELDNDANNLPTGLASNETDWSTNTTVKSFLLAALTISLGSVIKCALLGTFAEYLRCSLRFVDGPSQNPLDRQRPMRISSSRIDRNSFSFSNMFPKLKSFLHGAHLHAHSFVKTHSEYGMCHVAAYYKSFRRASSDVSSLILISGVEPILHDDITSIMCTTIASAITGWMTVFFFFSLSHHRGAHDPSSSVRLSDANVCQILFVQYCVCYLVLTTLLEPLRASIQAVYVAFAQCPESMCHAFPLVFHRLRRISEGSASDITEGMA